MPLIGSDFSDFPMGAAWIAAKQDERDQYIRLMITRLEPYGISDGGTYSEAQLGALASYTRKLFEMEGVGDLPIPPFVAAAIRIPRRAGVPAFSQVAQTVPVTNIPDAPATGTFILFSRDGALSWLPFPSPSA